MRELHALVGNAELDGMHLVFGVGSTQLVNAALYALAQRAAAGTLTLTRTRTRTLTLTLTLTRTLTLTLTLTRSARPRRARSPCTARRGWAARAR